LVKIYIFNFTADTSKSQVQKLEVVQINNK